MYLLWWSHHQGFKPVPLLLIKNGIGHVSWSTENALIVPIYISKTEVACNPVHFKATSRCASRGSHLERDALTEYANTIKARVWQHTNIPVSVGIGSTKCLAKIGTELIKQHSAYGGVLDMTGLAEQELDEMLTQVQVEDVWDIGRKYSLFLNNYAIKTARDLKDADQK